MSASLNVMVRARLEEHTRDVWAGVARVGADELGRRVLDIRFVLLPRDGRLYIPLEDILALAGQEDPST
jgi:hypothetical protein